MTIENAVKLTALSVSVLKYLASLCIVIAVSFVLFFSIGAGFYFGATAGGWMPEQEIHTENTNLFPSECVITEVSSAGVKQ